MAVSGRVALWQQHWDSGSMAQFYVKKPHPKLQEHLDQYIRGKTKAKILLPMCGNSFDIYNFGDMGHEVVGIECSALAIRSFYGKHNLSFTKEPCPDVQGTLYQSKDKTYKIYCCDFFDFKPSVEANFDVIVDFGAMGALTRGELQSYADLMKRLTAPDCRHILESFVYDVNKYPESQPICLTLELLRQLFGHDYIVEKIDEGPDPYADDMLHELTNGKFAEEFKPVVLSPFSSADRITYVKFVDHYFLCGWGKEMGVKSSPSNVWNL
ncbi:unnamed protein product [Lymnaea stagnalis]|uniref:thiopurine S-methyltransferase n=1 Tax=Lymnaea stagnalis TaxID=6523 RepID=A0AAV2GXE1_LYMST